MKDTRYYIGVIEVSGFAIVTRAFNFGWKNRRDLLVNSDASILDAVEFLRNKGIKVSLVLSNESLTQKEIDKNTETINKTLLPAVISVKPADNTIMKCFVDDSVYTIDTALLGEECWDVQIFGIMGCVGCIDRNKPTCCGSVSVIAGKNSLGNQIPIAVKVGDRPKRGKSAYEKKEESNG